MTHWIKSYLPALVALLLGAAAAACTGAETSSAEATDSLDEARTALADGNDATALKICDKLMDKDFDNLTEEQLCQMAMLYIRLSESQNNDEHIAEATRCVSRAWEISTDSLKSFQITLSPGELGQFDMLMRISGALSNPPDLTEEGMPDESLDADSIAAH